jgi:3'-5' exonuclease
MTNHTVVDIETVGQPLDAIEERFRDGLLASFDPTPGAGTADDARREEAARRFSLWGATGRVIVIGMHNPETGQSRVLAAEDEKELLREFWSLVRGFDAQITFNGKLFDFPFLLMRSAVHAIRPTVKLDCRRYTRHPHYDLREVLSNAYQEKRGSLDFFCSLFGIASPKDKMSGSEVGEAYRAGRLHDIAEYCRADVAATAALYLRVRDYF